MSEITDAVNRLLDEAFPVSGVPGVAVGVWAGGEEHFVVRGVTSTENPLPVDEDTLFQTGSTAKTYTASAVMRLVERGILDLDEPVRRYVPELRMAEVSVAERITLRHLLTHTGGHEGDLFDDFGGGDDCLSRLAAGMHVLPQLAPLGTFTYSNAGFSVAGRALETATRLVFEQAIAELLLRPLGHEHSVFSPADAITHRVAIGHRVVNGQPRVSRTWALPRTAGPAGGMASSVRDQVGYARFSLGDGTALSGERLLAAETLRLMQSPQVEAGGGRAAHLGISWLLQPTPGVIAHGGSTNGQESAFVIVPERNFAITVLTNSATGAHLHGPIVKWALRNVAGVPAVKPLTQPADPARIASYQGTFRSALEELVVEQEADGLVLSFAPTERSRVIFPAVGASGRMPFQVFADDRVLVTDGSMSGARGEFMRDEDGAVRWLRMLGRLHRR